ncbi:MAG: alpha-amylase/4-alpha-glucanotransferase domain-containing protein [Pirellulales bacterium]
MPAPLRLCLVLHNHQPIGNFDGVFEQAYQDSYLPFLDVFEQYPDELRISLHTSGPLMEWLDQRHGDYLDRVARLVAAGRIEIIGGPFYEPILTMIPARDRIGQIREYTRWLRDRLGADVQGMWMPERVWEQSLTSDLATAGMRYTVLDDFHFRNAGLSDEQLHGYYLSEDDGQLLSIFPGSERLRYTIPFAPPHETITYLREIAERQADAIVVFGDDGEKFGTWPDTKQHVYEQGWLRSFFDTLLSHRDWLRVTTLAEAAASVRPQGKIYLPDGSYREMTEWALPVARQREYDEVVHDLESDPRWPRLRRFVRGGFWRNFKVKYPEADEMYSRMLQVSQRLAEWEPRAAESTTWQAARRTLYRAQCNCSYWHGAFGGIYLPHLRHAVYQQLITADNLLDEVAGRHGPRVEIEVADFNLDARPEVRLTSDRLICLLAPALGGQLYELDVRSICHNLSATLARRPEAYHRKVQAGAQGGGGDVASIHDRVVFKQAGLEQRLQYDRHPRKSLIDHFYAAPVTFADVAEARAEDQGDFAAGAYEARIRRAPRRVQALLTRSGQVAGMPLRLTKGITLEAGSATLEVTYLLEGLPADRELHFGVEFNLAGLPPGLDDRYFHQGSTGRLGHLGQRLDLADLHDLGVIDQWLGIDVRWQADRPTGLWAFPVETVSQSEGGFELVHQSVVLHPHWWIRGDAQGQWSVTMRLTADTQLAESRRSRSAA